VKRLKAAAERVEGDIDLLLTCQWPAGVTAGVGALPDGVSDLGGSDAIAEAAVALRPRSVSSRSPDRQTDRQIGVWDHRHVPTLSWGRRPR
jgi:hypothetical protein